jgi:hypothetical protein
MPEDRIQLSVVVRIVGGPKFLRRCLGALVAETKGRPVEIIVPYDSTTGGIERVAADFPQVIFVEMGVMRGEAQESLPASSHQLYDRRTAAGLQIARGEILALLEDYGVPDPDWCDQLLEAHQSPFGVIGGAVEHSGTAILNWAVYFLDFARYQQPLREGPVEYLSDVNVSYKRPVLESSREVWAERYNEVAVHWELSSNGVILWQRPQVVVREDRGALSFRKAIRERYDWGRVFGSMRTRASSSLRRYLYIGASPLIPAVMLWRTARKVLRGRRNRVELLLAFPIMVVLACAWSVGELAAYLTGTEVSVPAADSTRLKPKDSLSHSNAYRR